MKTSCGMNARNFTIRNDGMSRLRPVVPEITFKAIAGLLEYQGLDDLYRIYAVCQRDGTDLKLAYIPKTFTEPERTDFDRVYMQKLYDFGFVDAKAGYHWAKQPPMLVGQEATPVKTQ